MISKPITINPTTYPAISNALTARNNARAIASPTCTVARKVNIVISDPAIAAKTIRR
jgi:hypothetical protein